MNIIQLPFLLILDRDGVIFEHIDPYILRDEDVKLIPGSLDAIVAFAKRGVKLAVVTNQSPIGRKLVAREFVERINNNLIEMFARNGAKDISIYYCPHTPIDGCSCRKPNIGLLELAAAKYNISLLQAWMVGDHETDIEAGCIAGVQKAIQLLSGRQKTISPKASLVFGNLKELAFYCGVL
ncbi:MAG: D-glycero-alpha-D-manno-heptose-1,7-bisphosphate 7-phosphatase [bacterium]